MYPDGDALKPVGIKTAMCSNSQETHLATQQRVRQAHKRARFNQRKWKCRPPNLEISIGAALLIYCCSFAVNVTAAASLNSI